MALKDLYEELTYSDLPDYKIKEAKDNLRQIAMNTKIRKEVGYDKNQTSIGTSFAWYKSPQESDYWLNIMCSLNFNTKKWH